MPKKMPIRKIDSVNEWATITYDEANVDLGGGMDIGTGNFTVPVSGIQSFSFSGTSKYGKTRTRIEVHKNKAKQFYIFENQGTESHDLLSTTWVMNLSQNDVISLYVAEGGFYVHGLQPIFFNGHLLK